MLTKIPLWLKLTPVILALAGMTLVLAALGHPFTLIVDGESRQMRSLSLTPAQILKQAGVDYAPQDCLSQPLDSWLFSSRALRLEHASQVTLRLPGGTSFNLQSCQRIPGLLLASSGIPLFPADRVLFDGVPVSPGKSLPYAPAYTLEFVPAQAVTLLEDGEARTFFSSAPTLGEALWEAGLEPGASDWISLPLETPLRAPLQVELRRPLPFTILSAGQSIAAQAAARSVGEALAGAGYALQGLDRSDPPEDAPFEEGMTIRLTRVHEEVLLEQTPIPFGKETVTDPEIPLGETRVLQAGQPGVEVARLRVRYEDGREVRRAEEARWVAAEPQTQKLGVGTQVSLQTVSTPYGNLEYWRSVTVYATSYSPCNSSPTRCYPNTASGARVQRGVIAVTRSWYNLFLGQRVYIPGYGIAVISDIGGGVPGKYWIDLGFSDNDYEAWHQDVTLYFLAPVPANVPAILP